MPYRTVPHRTAPYRALPADWQTCNRDCWCCCDFATTHAPKPGEGVSDYKEGSSRPESAQGKLLHTLGILHRPLPNFAKLHCTQQPQSDKERTLFFFPLRNLVLDSTPHTTHTHSHSHSHSHTPAQHHSIHSLQLTGVSTPPGSRPPQPRCMQHHIELCDKRGTQHRSPRLQELLPLPLRLSPPARSLVLTRRRGHATAAKQLPLESPLGRHRK